MLSTIVVPNRNAWRHCRAQAALAGTQGVKLFTIDQLAARLAGGFLQPVDGDHLAAAVAEAIKLPLGELDAVKALPGFQRAAAGSLSKAWSAGLRLADETASAKGQAARTRLEAMTCLEQEVLARLPKSELRPHDLVTAALSRIGYAKSLFGRIAIHGRTEMSPVWFWCKRRNWGIFAGKGTTRGRLTAMESADDLFKGRHFDREIIILCVRWYLRFKLSFRDLVEMMAERGLFLAHTTIMRWIQHYVPEFEKRWNRFARQAGGSWRVDETYVKIKGRWTYLYRAVDKQGKTVDFLLRAKRDVAAAKAFFRRAFKSQGRLPRAITLDGYQASHRAAREFLGEHRRGKRTKIRSSKYLNNLIEQDHRSIKLRLGPMLGLKRFRNASTTIAGIELIHRIRKGQFNLGELRNKDNSAPAVWNAVLAA